jgi:hypothetical protein
MIAHGSGDSKLGQILEPLLHVFRVAAGRDLSRFGCVVGRFPALRTVRGGGANGLRAGF